MNTSNPPYYQRHLFFCVNERAEPEACCARHGAQQALEYCQKQVKALALAGPGKVRVNKSGCLNRCAGAPVVVVYPEGVWYTYVDNDDIDEIIDTHLLGGQVVERLLLPPDVGR